MMGMLLGYHGNKNNTSWHDIYIYIDLDPQILVIFVAESGFDGDMNVLFWDIIYIIVIYDII